MSVHGLRSKQDTYSGTCSRSFRSLCSRQAQTARSPVAPRRELVEAVVREAYERFKSDTRERMPTTSLTSPK